MNIVQKQLLQLKTINTTPIGEGVTLQIEDDQYKAYMAITSSITNSPYTSMHFFVTGPRKTGKSFLLKSIEAWCLQFRQKPLLLAPTGIAANYISSYTIHSALSAFYNMGTYRSSIFSTNPDQANELRTIKVLIINKISIVDTQLFTFISTIFNKLH